MKNKGMPTWLKGVLGIVGVGAGAAAIASIFVKKKPESETDDDFETSDEEFEEVEE